MNYSEIVALSLGYVDRTDAETTDRVDDFLKVVESRINRFLKTRKSSFRATLPCEEDKEYYGLPSDFSGLRDIEIGNGELRTTMIYLSPEMMNGVTSKPQRPTTIEKQAYYTIIANQIQISPTQDATKFIEIVYFKNLTPIDSINTTNWLSDDSPDAYIFGLAAEVSMFAKDYEAATAWDQRFKQSLEEIKLEDKRDRWSGPSLQIRADEGYLGG